MELGGETLYCSIVLYIGRQIRGLVTVQYEARSNVLYLTNAVSVHPAQEDILNNYRSISRVTCSKRKNLAQWYCMYGVVDNAVDHCQCTENDSVLL